MEYYKILLNENQVIKLSAFTHTQRQCFPHYAATFFLDLVAEPPPLASDDAFKFASTADIEARRFFVADLVAEFVLLVKMPLELFDGVAADAAFSSAVFGGLAVCCRFNLFSSVSRLMNMMRDWQRRCSS